MTEDKKIEEMAKTVCHLDRTCMKPMVYSAHRTKEILYIGEYKGHKFCIMNLGIHPTAYVENKIHNLNTYDDERLYEIDVHGGFTYLDGCYWDLTDKDVYLGWDYGHCWDYAGFYEEYALTDRNEYKRWTTAEIYDEVKSVIEQLIPIEESEDTE